MALEKLRIFPEPDSKDPKRKTDFPVMFNPNTYTISKQVSWVQPKGRAKGGRGNDAKANAPTHTFGGGGARELALELFYDVTESGDPNADVRDQTDLIVKLTRIRRDAKHARPPICRIEWGGETEDFPFVGTVSNLKQQFLLFGESGKPLRATLSVSFTEFLRLSDDQRKTDPELTTRVVRRGDTLASIAAEVYSDPAAWRVIAGANRIENPFDLVPGTKLTLPKQ
jgi:nucleoid-associated protein YgaU